MTIFNKLEVSYANASLRSKAEQLACQLHLTVNQNSKHCLFVAEDKLSLKLQGFSLVFADFSSEIWKKRKAEGKKQAIIRACKPAPGQKIIDVTAGWGRDGAILASFGAEVLMLERQPVMAMLLEDALDRRDSESQKQLQLSLMQVDAKDYLKALRPENYPDVIYLDPMHPVRQKSALVKKEMQILQQMIGADEDALELLQIAQQRVKQKVVVKWPQKLAPLLPPSTSVEGKTVRYDIYYSK